MAGFRRRLGTFLIALGILGLAYGAAVYFWRDPVTDVYARWKQHELSGDLAQVFAEQREAAGLEIVPDEPAAPAETGTEPGETDPTASDVQEPPDADLEATVHTAAERVYDALELGQPLGRLRIPELDLRSVVVNGTRWGADLSRGPGRYPETSLPGLGRLTAIAGHRTTFGAPFRHIDRLQAGDEIVLELAYGTFHYVVVEHEIVDDEDWSIIEQRPYETLVLSACHPLFSATQRWIVYARLDRVELPGGGTYEPPEASQAAALSGG
ncbi:MAG: class E sortase [Thermoleophilia bacterium]|nr:class E sortase [Thermoleophilia bacterium]